jgi:predicted DNA binding CopG/RHH family protein
MLTRTRRRFDDRLFLTLRCSRTLLRQISEAASAEGIPRSAWVRRVLSRSVRARRGLSLEPGEQAPHNAGND